MARILVVEDEHRFRHYLVRALRLEGHDVVDAGSGTDATKKLRSFEPQILVVDHMLGVGEDGLELAARLKARFPGLRAILITGYPLDELNNTVGTGAIHALLAKPFSPALLLKTVDRLAREAC
jgi:CheY-like chemotaxis protein